MRSESVWAEDISCINRKIEKSKNGNMVYRLFFNLSDIMNKSQI